MNYQVRNKSDYFSKIVRIIRSKQIEKSIQELKQDIYSDLSVAYKNQYVHIKYNDSIMLGTLNKLVETDELLITKREQVGVHPEDGIPVVHEYLIVNPKRFDEVYDLLVEDSKSIQFGEAYPTPSKFKLSMDLINKM